MASVNPVLAESSLKVPATEIVDLSEESSGDELTSHAQPTAQRDASPNAELNVDEDDGDDDQWSLYEDALEGMGDEELLNGSMYS